MKNDTDDDELSALWKPQNYESWSNFPFVNFKWNKILLFNYENHVSINYIVINYTFDILKQFIHSLWLNNKL